MEYLCSKCQLLLPAESFPKDPRNVRRDGLSSWCRNCKRLDAVVRYHKDPEKARANSNKRRNRDPVNTRKRHLKAMYGLTPETHAELLASQGGVCAICGRTEAGGKTGTWHTDHDHITKKVRGILCHSCNIGLGHFGDSLERLLLAALYLERHSE